MPLPNSDPNRPRRTLILGLGASLVASFAQAETRRSKSLAFQVFRNSSPVGTHRVVFNQDAGRLTATITADIQVGLGPLKFFSYRHEVTELWQDGLFQSLESRTLTNRKLEQVFANRTSRGVEIRTLAGETHLVPAAARPLTHWNMAALQGPLFNPQTGSPVREKVQRVPPPDLDQDHTATTAFALTGDVEITDGYDENGDWVALKAKAADGSVIHYRRIG